VGEAPDGNAWTGFVSVNDARDGGYALLFRETNPGASYDLPVPLIGNKSGKIEVLGGDGQASLQNGVLHTEIPQTLRFLWAPETVALHLLRQRHLGTAPAARKHDAEDAGRSELLDEVERQAAQPADFAGAALDLGHQRPGAGENFFAGHGSA